MMATWDWGWFMLEYQDSAKWNVTGEKVPMRVNQTIGRKQVMLTVIWGIDGFDVVDMMPTWRVSTPSTFLFVLSILCW
jgi:hypothetical protein